MKNSYSKLLPLLMISIAGIANAESIIYKMHDEKGNVIYTDRVPPNEKGEYAILSPKSGVLKATVARELNKEEVVKLNEKAIEDKKIIDKSEMQKRKDTALLSTYSNVAEIEKIKKFEMTQLEQSIKSSVDIIANIKDRMSQVKDNAKENPNNKRVQEESAKLINDLDTANKTLDYNKDLMSKRSIKYDEDKARYEQILKEMNTGANTVVQ